MHVLLLFIILFYSRACLGALCRLSNNHENYTCHGFRFNQLTVSRPTKLQILRARIYDCKEVNIPAEVLKFPNVENLTMSCDIKTIDQNAFSNLNHVKELDLSNNTISELPEDLFKSLENVYLLNLTQNNFQEITKNMFNGLTNLNKLILSFNSVSTLHTKAFNKMRHIQELYLDNNVINFIPIVVFNRLTKLKHLDLSYNNIHVLSNLFTQSNGLVYLNLSHNQIEELPARIFTTTNLQSLDLSFNELKSVYQEALKLDTLEKFYLQNNKLSLFEVIGLGSKRLPLKFLDLRNNRLVFLEESFVLSAKELSKLKTNGNPWDCNCLEQIKTGRDSLNLQIESQSIDEDVPICITSESNGCRVNKDKLEEYYNIFKQVDDS